MLATLGSAALLEGVFQFLTRLQQWRNSGWRHFVVALVSICLGVGVLVVNQWRISPPPTNSNRESASTLNASDLRSKYGPNAEDAGRSDGSSRDMPYLLKTYDRAIHASLPRFRFRVSGLDSNDDEVAHRILIEVRREGSLESFQAIQPSTPADISFLELQTSEVDDDDGVFFVVEDLNFDGYADFRYLANHSVCCYQYSCYTYDKHRGLYRFNATLTEIFASHTHVEIRRRQRQLVRYVHCAPGDIKLVYEWDGFDFAEITGQRCS
jgi:hypothetical protein